MATRPPSLMALPSYLVGSVARIGHQHLIQELATHGLRLPQYAVLAALSDFGPMAPNEVATCLQADRSHVSSYIEVLAQRGLVARHFNLRDRRRHAVHLTEEGATLFTELSTAARDSQKGFLDCLTAPEREMLLHLLTLVIEREDIRSVAQP